MELVTLVLALAVVVALVTRRFRHLNRLKHIPGPKAYPFIGNAMDLVVPANPLVEHIVTRYFMKYNQIFTLWMGPVPTVFVFQPHHVQAILGNGKHLDKPFIYGFPKKWLGTGLLTSTGTKWQSRRKLIHPSFHLSLLENFLHVFCEKSHQLVRELQQHENSAQEFDAYSLVTKCTLDIICETAMGTQMKTNDKKGDLSYMEAVHEGTVLLMERFLLPWLYLDFIYWNTNKGKRFLQCVKVIHAFTDKVNGYTLPAGLMVILPSFLTHRLSQYFPDPDKFDPDRFLPENVANRHPYAYIPFSAGPRNCIGQKFALLEVKTVLSFVLRHLKVSAVWDKLTPIVEVTIKPAEGFKLTISGRDSGFHSSV